MPEGLIVSTRETATDPMQALERDIQLPELLTKGVPDLNVTKAQCTNIFLD